MRRRIASIAIAAMALAVLPAATGIGAGAAAAADPVVVPIQVTGDPADRFSMVIMGDGYTEAEMPKFREHVEKHLNVLWSIEPFRSYRNYINVYAVEVASNESGVDCDPNLTSPRRDTALNMGFWGGCNASSVQRLLTVNNTIARGYATLATPEFDQILAIANSDTYGGAGGAYATASGGNALSSLITPHELGHSLGGLQDEYTYYGRGVPGGRYTGGEPSSIHHTLLTEQQMLEQQRKWWRWLGEPSESGGVIGRYEGGQYFDSGIWKPSKHSMMISLGYYFDQVSRERMTQRISARVNLIEKSTPSTAPVGPTDVVWLETAHPVYHELDVTWRVNGSVVASVNNSRNLDLEAIGAKAGDTVNVTVVDPTDFVRDPAIRASTSMTATRSWTVGATPSVATPVEPRFTASLQNARAVGSTDVVYVETTHPADRVLDVVWHLDGAVVANTDNSRNFDLGARNLSAGPHTLTATVSDPANASAPGQTLTWSVDNTEASVDADFTEPLTTIGGAAHNVYFEQFSMKLNPTDDQPGYVVAEFRRNGDGWHHYYGWPDAPQGTPYTFTPRGTNIADLIYGSLSPEGLSPQPWEERKPGYGTHLIEYRGIDAAGNIGGADSIKATVVPGASPACTETLTGAHRNLVVSSGVTCLDAATVTGGVTVLPGASLVAHDSLLDNGGLNADGAAVVQLFGTTVNGPSTVSGTTNNVTVAGSTFSGAQAFTGNASGSYGVALVGNTFNGDVSCSGNTATVSDFGAPNRVAGSATGQCGTLANVEFSTALSSIGDLLDQYNGDGTVSDRTTASLRDRLGRAQTAADLGHEQQAIGYLEQFIARAQNQVKGSARDAMVRDLLVAAARTAIAQLRAADEAELAG